VVSSATRKYAGKVRYGRGFTLDEIQKAGLTAQFARTVGIAVDHRRTNTSTEQMQLNVSRLETYKSKMILFPRREGKPKRGLIHDATAEQLKSAASSHQVTGHVLPIVPAAHVVEHKAIGNAANNKVFRTLRNLRTHKRYKGRREMKAKKDAEAKKDVTAAE
jgi:large subunit ribosomal protein L13e